MKICDMHDHKGAYQVLIGKDGIWSEINNIFNNPLVFGKVKPQRIKISLSKEFNRLGWADRVKIHNNNRLTISFLKDKVGICIQLGNVARTYADLLKLTYLGNKRIIDVGVIFVPDEIESKIMGANYARYDRLSREIEVFGEIIDIPLLIISLGN